jgi:hypothetical protein
MDSNTAIHNLAVPAFVASATGIRSAYTEGFLPTPSSVVSKPPASKAAPPRGAQAPIEPINSGNRVPSDQPTKPPKAMSTQFYDTQVNTVDFQILFTKRNREALLDTGRVIVTSAMSGNGFAAWQISLFIQKLNRKTGSTPAVTDGIPKPADWTDDEAVELAVEVFPTRATSADRSAAALAQIPIERVIGLKPENLQYLQADYQIISTFDRKPPKYDAEQVDALREIAAVIKNRP